LYCRISRDTEGDGLGVERQEKILRKIAKSAGVTVADVFPDNDVSATSSKVRPQWRAMLDRIDEFDVIMALDSDRLLRKPGDLEELFALCEKYSVRVMYEHGGFDPITGDGMMEMRIRAAVDAEEVRKLNKRVARKNRELLEAGRLGSGGGDRPFGFAPDRLTLDPAEAPIVRELVARLLAGDSIRGCCADLDARGITTTTGRTWNQTTLRRLVTSARIAGMREDNEEPGKFYAAVWPAIIEPEELIELRAKLSDPIRRTRWSAGEYLLTGGIARCGLCGVALVARPNDRKQRRYVCAKGVGLKGCGKIMRLAEPVESWVSEAIFATVDSPEFAATLAAHQRHSDSASARDTVTRLQAKQAELAKAWANDGISTAEWDAARVPLAERLEAAEAAAAAVSATRAVDAYVGRPGALRGAWEGLSHDRRRDIVATLLRSLTILPNPTPGRNAFNPDLLVPDWRY
jgi:DNA invertase Pin-like site-specific DNA recombinase